MQNYEIKVNDQAKELTKHGYDDFACAHYDEEFSKFVTGEVPWHWHEEVEFVYVVQGSTKIECINHTVTLQSQEAAFINTNCLHKLTDVGVEDCRILNFVLSPVFFSGSKHTKVYKNFVAPVLNNKQLSVYKFTAQSTWHKQLIRELNKAFKVFQSKAGVHELQAQIHLMKVWDVMCTNEKTMLEKNIISSASEHRVHAFLQYIQNYFTKKISVADISQSANVSESECYRVFKKALKCSPNSYLLDYRLRQAANLLLEKHIPITQIAYLVGFNCPAYFSKRFKSAYSKTPKQFRAQQ